MGYISYHTTKAELVSNIKSENSMMSDWSLVGNHLWGLYQAQSDCDRFKSGDLIIHLFLIKSFGGGEYGYKCMSESVHPYYYTCPIKLLKKAVVLSPEWREKVLAHHANKAVKKVFNVGDIIPLKNCNVKEVVVRSVKPLIGYDKVSGREYKIPPRLIA